MQSAGALTAGLVATPSVLSLSLSLSLPLHSTSPGAMMYHMDPAAVETLVSCTYELGGGVTERRKQEAGVKEGREEKRAAKAGSSPQ